MGQTAITKSIRLAPDEAKELGQLSEKTALSEAALMKKWIIEGIRAEKLEQALLAYMRRQVDLRAGSTLAGVSYHRFMREVEARNIVILEETGFLDRLEFLADAFQDQALRKAIQNIRTEETEVSPAN
ncbi:MAG: hypothetical protein KF832_00230 [Caldilineaceae bacterium]|nr:hypothetical protein [Caldilineaceae bacterium]